MSPQWLIIRGSGTVAFGLLALSMVWGLLLSTKVLGRAAKAKVVTMFHESLAIAAVLATVVHVVVVYDDEYLEFTAREVLVPGTSDWRPVAVAMGVVALYALVVVTVSFYVRRWLGQERWRTLHHAAFGTFVAALVHGVLAGTDRAQPLVVALYVGAVVAVGLLVVVRTTGAAARGSSPGRERTVRAGAAARTPAATPGKAPAGAVATEGDATT